MQRKPGSAIGITRLHESCLVVTTTSGPMSFLDELKRRNVIRVAVAYAAGSWLLVKLADTLLPLFGFDSAIRPFVILLAVAFLPAMVLSYLAVWGLVPGGLKAVRETLELRSTFRSVRS